MKLSEICSIWYPWIHSPAFTSAQNSTVARSCQRQCTQYKSHVCVTSAYSHMHHSELFDLSYKVVLRSCECPQVHWVSEWYLTARQKEKRTHFVRPMSSISQSSLSFWGCSKGGKNKYTQYLQFLPGNRTQVLDCAQQLMLHTIRCANKTGFRLSLSMSWPGSTLDHLIELGGLLIQWFDGQILARTDLMHAWMWHEQVNYRMARKLKLEVLYSRVQESFYAY